MKKIKYSDKFQKNYSYELAAPQGKDFYPDFQPELSPKQMFKLGVFGGAYFIGVSGLIPSDLPKSWFRGARLSPDGEKHVEYNLFKVRASQPLEVWQKKGWIHPDDPHGWFQWYCRYWMGRRTDDDERQIKRWRAYRRHLAQVEKNCHPRDLECRPKQRQSLLHWAYDSRKI